MPRWIAPIEWADDNPGADLSGALSKIHPELLGTNMAEELARSGEPGWQMQSDQPNQPDVPWKPAQNRLPLPKRIPTLPVYDRPSNWQQFMAQLNERRKGFIEAAEQGYIKAFGEDQFHYVAAALEGLGVDATEAARALRRMTEALGRASTVEHELWQCTNGHQSTWSPYQLASQVPEPTCPYIVGHGSTTGGWPAELICGAPLSFRLEEKPPPPPRPEVDHPAHIKEFLAGDKAQELS